MDFISLPGFTVQDDNNGRLFQELLLGSPKKWTVQRTSSLLVSTSVTFEREVSILEIRIVSPPRLHTMLLASFATPDEMISGFTNDGGSLHMKGPLKGCKFAISVYGHSTIGGKYEISIDKIIIDYVEGRSAGTDLLCTFDDASNRDNFRFNFPKENRTMFASRSLLSARSEVMNRMLNNAEMKEGTTQSVDITETEYTVFKEFLEYFYTDTIQSQTRNLVELFALADQYQFARLRMAAFNSARKNVSASSVLRMAQEAQRFRAEDISLMLLSYARTRKCPPNIFRELAILYVSEKGHPVSTLSLLKAQEDVDFDFDVEHSETSDISN